MPVNFTIDKEEKIENGNGNGTVDDTDKDFDDDLMSTEFDSKYGISGYPTEYGEKFSRPDIGKSFSYEVVGRLSRWEGGNSSPYEDHDLGATGDERSQPKKMSILEFLKQFVRPTYDLTEVTIEDIERVKVMHDRFSGDAQFSFNYSTLLVIASVIAGVGLGSNSSASIIASMLVSP
jgi:hypothetical protein